MSFHGLLADRAQYVGKPHKVVAEYVDQRDQSEQQASGSNNRPADALQDQSLRSGRRRLGRSVPEPGSSGSGSTTGEGMTECTRQIGRTMVPTLLYGTAWKEGRTADLVTQALRKGFRGLDTANQRRHYHEAEVGRALQAELERGTLGRDDVFVQTKFTYRMGQDHRLPYDPAAPVGRQVEQSFDRSLAHLGVDVVDSYLLHAPSLPQGLGTADIEVWRAVETLHDAGRVRFLGVSNFAPDQLAALLRAARVRPTFLQNRCYASRGWDANVRAVCAHEGVTYQGFSLLTANEPVVRSSLVLDIARRHRRSPAQVILRFALQVGMIVLTGTTSPQHMADDLAVYEFELTSAEMNAIEHGGI